MRAVRRAALLAAAGASLHGADAAAVVTPAHLAERPQLELLGGREDGRFVEGRPARVISAAAPRHARVAWSRFVSSTHGEWEARWDLGRGVPSRIWGRGLPAPGSVSSAADAERWAESVLHQHLDLLAPGSDPKDFVLVANDLDRGLRTVGFSQRHLGYPVLGGQVSFRFRADRLVAIGSEALPDVAVSAPHRLSPESRLRAAAESWLLSTPVAASVKIATVEGPMILPVDGGRRGSRVVYRVVADATEPIGKWAVYLDAATAAPIAREQTLRFADGTVSLFVPDRYPGGGRSAYPAPSLDLTVDGVLTAADVLGAFVWPGAAVASVAVSSLSGQGADVQSAGGPEASLTFDIDPGATYLWDASSAELDDSQLSTYIHAHVVKDYARGISPAMAWLDTQLEATVNIDDACNAFSDGFTINFFRAAQGCDNTGRLADVVYHEFGHAYHLHSIIPGTGDFEGALSEGVSDYLAATITGDSGMGRGFTFTSEPLREIDPIGFEHVWPDHLVGEVHHDGLIIAGALWDLRELLVEKLGPTEGRAHADFLYQQGTRRAVDIPSMYPEVLVADDDDGDLDNGTPNACEINEAFGLHGLRSVTAEIGSIDIAAPDVDGYGVSIELTGLNQTCESDAIQLASLRWEVEGKPTQSGTIALSPQLSGATAKLSADIPKQAPGSVVRYRIELVLASGAVLTYPHNPADPTYQLFVGDVVELYCTDFEKSPESDGWTHSLDQGEPSEGADDWQWGHPNGTATNGDPTDAFSGTRVFGNDLGLQENFNGLYQSDKINSARSPVIDTQGYEVVRLQYRRWLNVEDAFFDRASIYANGELVWSNLNSDQGEDSDVHHRDREWRFHDVDLSEHVDDGEVQVRFEMASDQGLELGGWTIDDFCVVAFDAALDPGGCVGSECGGAGGQGAGSAVDPIDDGSSGVAADDGGCGCRTAGGGSSSRGGASLAALALGAALLRRPRRSARSC